MDQLVGAIASASEEQNRGISQVNLAVTQMDKVTQGNAATAEETASASEELSSQAAALKDELNRLTGSQSDRELEKDSDGSSSPKPTRKHLKPVARFSSPASNGASKQDFSLNREMQPLKAGIPAEGDFKDF